MNLRVIFFLFSSFLILLLSIFNPYVIAVNEAEANISVNEAEKNLALTFEAVKEAEINGADISGMSQILNDAIILLAQAKNFFRVGDFDKAENFANLVIEIGNEVKGLALSLGDVKSDLPINEMWDTLIGSLISVILVVVVSLFSWIFFKRYYYRRKSLMKPEVAFCEY